jgi:hypothetical protein
MVFGYQLLMVFTIYSKATFCRSIIVLMVLMEATLLCLMVPMVCFKPNVCGVNYPFIFCLLIIQMLFITSVIM